MENCFEKEDIVLYLRLFVLLYVDDTIVLAESPTQLQSALDALFLTITKLENENLNLN